MVKAYYDWTTTSKDTDAAYIELIKKMEAFKIPGTIEVMAADFASHADVIQSFDTLIQNSAPGREDYSSAKAIANRVVLTRHHFSSIPIICSSAVNEDAFTLVPDGSGFKPSRAMKDIAQLRFDGHDKAIQFSTQYLYPSEHTRYDFCQLTRVGNPGEPIQHISFPTLFIHHELLHDLEKAGLRKAFCKHMAELLRAGHDYIHAVQNIDPILAARGYPDDQPLPDDHPLQSEKLAALLTSSICANAQMGVREEPVAMTLNSKAVQQLPRTSNHTKKVATAAVKVFGILDKITTPQNKELVQECRLLATMLVANLAPRAELDKTPVAQWGALLKKADTPLSESIPLGDKTIRPEDYPYMMHEAFKADLGADNIRRADMLLDIVQHEMRKPTRRVEV